MDQFLAFALSGYGIAILLAVVLFVGSIWYAMRSLNDFAMAKRVAKVTGNKAQLVLDQVEAARAKSDRLERTISRMPTLDSTQMLLRRAGLNLNVRTYTIMVLFAGGLASLLLDVPFIVPAIEPIVYVLGLHLAMNMAVLPALAARHKGKIVQQLPEAIDYIARALGVGQSLETSIKQAVPALDNPLRKELAVIPRLLDLGLTLPDALDAVASELDCPEFDFMVAACKVQLESGGNLVDVLNNLSDMIRSRHHLRMKVAALSAEGRVSTILLSSFPVLMFFYLNWARPAYMAPLYAEFWGQVLLYAIFILIAIGGAACWWIARIRI